MMGTTTESSVDPLAFSADVDITFGRGPSCISRGLCSVDDVGSIGNPGDATGLFMKESSGALKLEIAKSNISVQQKELQFAEGTFSVTEAFYLSQELSSQLGAASPIHIPVGDYTVQELPDRFIVEF